MSLGMVVLGGILTIIPGTQAVGIPLLVSGAVGTIGSLIAPRPAGSHGWEDSQTYGWGQSVNPSFEGMPSFIVYGEERVTPSLVSAVTEMSGKKSFLKLLFFCGHGGSQGIRSISDVEINDEPVGNFKKIEIATRLGTSDQAYIPGFEKVGIPYLTDHYMEKKEWITYTSKDEVDELAVILSWRGGLYHVDGKGSDQGKIEETEWKMHVQYRIQGSTGDWTEIPGPSKIKGDGWYQRSDNGWGCKEKITSEFQLMVRLPFSARRKYEIRMQGGDDDTERYRRVPTWIRTEEIKVEKRTYAGDALLALSVMAQPQLSGGLPRVTALVRGRKVYDPRLSAWVWSRNPSLIIRDFLLDADNACGDWIVSSDIADASGQGFRTVATACEVVASMSSTTHKQPKFELDIVIDTHRPASEWLNHMLGTFRAAVVEYQGQLHLVQEGPAASSRTFDARQVRSASNRPVLMLEDGRADIAVSEINTDERPNIVKSFYRDRSDGYQRKVTDEVKDTVRLAAGDPEVRNELYLAGVTRGAQALRQCRYVLNKGRLTPRRITVGVGIGDLDLVPCEVATLYADNPPYDGDLFLVEAITYRADFTARLSLRQYDISVYLDTLDTLPALPAQLSYEQAIKKYRTPAVGAQSVSLQEVA